MKIVFMGTPEFAVPSLDILLKAGYDIVGVITSTDKMGGRGRKELLQSDVKKYALEKGLNILQPPNLKNPQFVEELRSLQADLQIVVAFRMLPEVVWNMPKHGTYNLHGSLLPNYRGAAPINWAIINGEEKTGVTTFKLKHAIDTGSIAYQSVVPILRSDKVESLHDKMKEVGAELILKTVKEIDAGTLSLKEQDENAVTEAPKIYHKDCHLDMSHDIFQAYNYIRGLSPYPTAWSKFDDKKIKIFRALYSYEMHNYDNGTYVSDGKRWLKLYGINGYLDLKEVQLEGRKRMDVRSFLNGFNLQENKLPFLLSSK